jgi:TolB-like protein/tetratricopeptide (TPR) repeat protein
MGGAPVHQPLDPSSKEDRLDSWKDIATYLSRSVPTVQRWEKEEGLPVHRHLHKKQGSIYAYRQELDDWRQKRRAVVESPEETAPSEPAAVEIPAVPRRWRFVLTVAVVIAALSVGTVFLLKGRRSGTLAAARVMIAVLPFQNLGGGPNLEYVCDGLTEELITELAAFDPQKLGIIARTSAMVYKSGGRSVRDIGRDLGVEYIVEGSVLFTEAKSRITVQLIRVSDQSHVWAHTYDGKIDNLLDVEQEISRAVAEEVNVHVSAVHQRPSTRQSSDPEVSRLYMQGRQLWYRRSQADLAGSITLFEEALKRDPKFAPAYAGIADSYNQLGYLGFRPLGVAIAKSQAAAQRALELDPQLADAHAALGFINAMWIWEWKEAESRYQRAIASDPGYVPAHHFYALFLASAGRLEEAKEQMAIAQRLDPLEPAVNSGSAYVLYFDRQYEKSIEFCERALKRDPRYAIAHALLGWDYLQLKQYPEAIVELSRALSLAPENSLYLATLGRAYMLSGQTEDADGVSAKLNELSSRKFVGASTQAIMDSARNDRDSAFAHLRDAAKQEDGFLLWLKVAPEFDSLRADPRFQQLIAQIGLPASIQ